MASEEDRAPLSSEVKRLEGEVGPHAHHPLLHLPVFEQLKQRNVFRVAVLYLMVCWLILDPLHVVFHMLEVPAWANRLVIMLMAVGFPAVLIFAWVYEITPAGLKPTHEVPHEQSIRKLTGRRLDMAIIAVLCVALAYFVVDKFWISKHLASMPTAAAAAGIDSRTSAAPPPSAAFKPPPQSIAVLPFVNMSGDKEQDYFADGLSEELLNSLSRINELQVAARTSSFYFRGEHVDLSTIAHKLNVASVLEGSVRRSGHTIRITAQLNNALTGFHLWSQTYDRNLSDVLQIQTEIASSVASALKVKLLGDVVTRIEMGGTHNPEAFDAYLRASKAYRGALDEKGLQAAIAGYTEAIRRDPDYALVYADCVIAQLDFARNWAPAVLARDYRKKAEANARKAIALAPDLAEAHLALAYVLEQSLEFAAASHEYERALVLASGNVKLLRHYGSFVAYMGRAEASLAAARRSVALDPLNPLNYFELGVSFFLARRSGEAIKAFADAQALAPDDPSLNAWFGLAYYLSGDFQSARAACERAVDINRPICLAMVYDKLGRRADAETMLKRSQAGLQDPSPFCAMIYAQWGDNTRALEWLETAMRQRNPYLEYLKTLAYFDPLRKEPRFQAIERALKFPD